MLYDLSLTIHKFVNIECLYYETLYMYCKYPINTRLTSLVFKAMGATLIQWVVQDYNSAICRTQLTRSNWACCF